MYPVNDLHVFLAPIKCGPYYIDEPGILQLLVSKHAETI